MSVVGIYGGSFDPLHNGHKAVVDFVLQALEPQVFYLVPCHMPPHKEQLTASNSLRLSWLKALYEGVPSVIVDERELLSEKISYSVDTLQQIRDMHADACLLFIIGLDSWRNFTRWHRWLDILKLTNLLVVNRPSVASETGDADRTEKPIEEALGTSINALTCDLAEINRYSAGRIVFTDEPNVDISSSQIRAAAKSGVSVSQYLPPIVEKDIKQHNLYEE